MDQETEEEQAVDKDQQGQADNSNEGCGYGTVLTLSTIIDIGWYLYAYDEGMFNGKGFFEKLLGNPLIYIPLLILIAVIYITKQF